MAYKKKETEISVKTVKNKNPEKTGFEGGEGLGMKEKGQGIGWEERYCEGLPILIMDIYIYLSFKCLFFFF